MGCHVTEYMMCFSIFFAVRGAAFKVSIVRFSFMMSGYHSRIVPSYETLASRSLLEGLNARSNTVSVWPASV